MSEAIIRVIWGTHRGKSFPDAPGRDEWWRKNLGSDVKIFLCEAPENPHELYSELTDCVGKVIDSRHLLHGYEIGVRDINLLCWITLLKQSGALLHPVFSPIFRTRERELSLVESFSPGLVQHASFSHCAEVVEVVPSTTGVIPWL